MTSGSLADCHVHIFGGSGYAFPADTPYVQHPSQMGTAENLRAVLDSHGISHALLVAAQPYGRDNRCMLAGIASSRGRFKGVALVDPAVTDRELAALSDVGVVGLRINLSTYGLRELTEPGAEQLFARVCEMGWFVQVHCEANLSLSEATAP